MAGGFLYTMDIYIRIPKIPWIQRWSWDIAFGSPYICRFVHSKSWFMLFQLKIHRNFKGLRTFINFMNVSNVKTKLVIPWHRLISQVSVFPRCNLSLVIKWNTPDIGLLFFANITILWNERWIICWVFSYGGITDKSEYDHIK